MRLQVDYIDLSFCLFDDDRNSMPRAFMRKASGKYGFNLLSSSHERDVYVGNNADPRCIKAAENIIKWARGLQMPVDIIA